MREMMQCGLVCCEPAFRRAMRQSQACHGGGTSHQSWNHVWQSTLPMSGTPLWNRLAPFGRWCTLLSCSSCSAFQTFESCCSCSCISTCEQADQRCACWQSKLDRTQASERPGTDLSSSTKDSIASFDLHDPVLPLTLTQYHSCSSIHVSAIHRCLSTPIPHAENVNCQLVKSVESVKSNK